MKLEHDVIPSITDIKKLKAAVRTVSPFILLNNCNIANLGNLVKYGHKHNHRIFVNVENIVGLYITSDSLRLLKKVYGVDGIYTTSKHTARRASKLGIPTVLRVFFVQKNPIDRIHRNLSTGFIIEPFISNYSSDCPIPLLSF